MYQKFIFFFIIFTLLAFPSGQVSALCSGSACNGTDPGTTGCAADAATVRQKWPYGTPGPVNATLKNWYWRQRNVPPNDTVYSNQRYGSNGFQACGDYRSSPFTGPVTASGTCTSIY
jgi:hypothetical protein